MNLYITVDLYIRVYVYAFVEIMQCCCDDGGGVFRSSVHHRSGIHLKNLV